MFLENGIPCHGTFVFSIWASRAKDWWLHDKLIKWSGAGHSLTIIFSHPGACLWDFFLFSQKLCFIIDDFVATIPKCQFDFPEPVDTCTGSPLDGTLYPRLPQVPSWLWLSLYIWQDWLFPGVFRTFQMDLQRYSKLGGLNPISPHLLLGDGVLQEFSRINRFTGIHTAHSAILIQRAE